MMCYFVVKHADIDKLCRHVNQMLLEGWTLQGGVAICDVQFIGSDGGYSERHYAQAMTNPKGLQHLNAQVKDAAITNPTMDVGA